MPEKNCKLTIETPSPDQAVLILHGRLDLHCTTDLWNQVQAAFRASWPSLIVVHAHDLEYCDGTGISFILSLKRIQLKKGRQFKIEGLKKDFAQLMQLLEPRIKRKRIKRQSVKGLVEDIGTAAMEIWSSLTDEIAFIGELICSFAMILVHPRKLRRRDTLIIAETTGADAFGIISLIGFLFGLILAFQSAVPMKQFGAEIYVADLVSLSLLRVLGPFIAAIIYTARSGSAFAAEIGTMKVNEELDALTTMGLNPVQFLVVPRVFAATLVVPMLTLFVILFGLIGAGVVMITMGYPMITFWNQIVGAVDFVDFSSGYVKSFVFGFLVAALGCYRGLCTGSGSRAVGASATSAVVSGIVGVVITEGIFAVIYYYLDI